MSTLRRGTWLLALVILSLSTPAAAESRRVLVFPLTGTLPGDAAGAVPRLAQVVTRAAGLTGAEVIVGKSRYEDVAALAGCGAPDAACLALVAAQLAVDAVVLGSVAPGDDGDSVTIDLIFFDGGELHEKSITLAGSDADGWVKQLAREAPALFDPRPATPVEEPVPVEPKPEAGPEVPAAAVPVTPPPGEPGPRQRRGLGGVSAVSWLIAGAGVAALAGGAVFGLQANDRQEQVDAAPTRTVADLERLQTLEDEGERAALISNALFVGGGVAIAVGGALILKQGLAWEPVPRGVEVTAVPLRGGAAVTLKVRLP